jgi:hypothetical protein
MGGYCCVLVGSREKNVAIGALFAFFGWGECDDKYLSSSCVLRQGAYTTKTALLTKNCFP